MITWSTASPMPSQKGHGWGPSHARIQGARKVPVKVNMLKTLRDWLGFGDFAHGHSHGAKCHRQVVRGFKKERKDWEVLIPNHHEDYLSWADYERNLGLIADNANGKNPMSRGALRGARPCLPVCCAVAIAGVSCMSPTPALTAIPAATTARAASSIMAEIAVSRSAACASIARSALR
jgi:hypothetical protein